MKTREFYKGYTISTYPDGKVEWYQGFTTNKVTSVDIAKRQIDRAISI